VNKIKRELARQAQHGAHRLIENTVDSFDAAGLSRNDAASCIGVTFLRLAVTLMVHSKGTKQAWLEICNDAYDEAAKATAEIIHEESDKWR
jgi:hypothetical protein